MKQPSVYVLSSCDTSELSLENYVAVTEHVKTKCDNEPVVICCDTVQHKKSFTLCEYVLSLCRRHGLLKNERATLLSAMDQMVAVQLCLAEKNKQDIGDYDVESSTAIHQNNLLIKKKLSECDQNIEQTEGLEDWLDQAYTQLVSYCNQLDTCDVLKTLVKAMEENEQLKEELLNTELVVMGLPCHQIQKCMLKTLCNRRAVYKVTMETSLENSSDVTVSSEPSSLEDIQQSNGHSSPSTKPLSITESYVRMVFLSYLELLVNTRSELALARSLNVPNRDLTHEAFTELKREAKIKNMTMYQTAVSHILKIRLGGKGYAPDPNHPLSQFVKGLGEFVDLMQKLQNFIEEESDTKKACRKIIIGVKKELIKSQDSKLRPSSIENVAETLLEQLSIVIEQSERNKMTSPGKSVSDGGSLLGRKTLQILRSLTDKLLTQQDQSQSLDYLCDGFSSQKTPIRFPSILSQFRSPDEGIELDEEDASLNLSLSDRLLSKGAKKTPLTTKSNQAFYDWALPAHNVGLPNKDDVVMTNSPVIVLPSKTLVAPASSSKSGLAKTILESINDQENIKVRKGKKFNSEVTKQTENSKTDVEVEETTSQTLDVPVVESQNGEKGGKKRKSSEMAAPSKKKAKTESKSCRRKLLPQVKGQQQLNMFFRV